MPKHQLIIVSKIVLIAAAILFPTTSFSQQAQYDTQIQQDKALQDEATVVQKGKVTETERTYSNEPIYLFGKVERISEAIESSKKRGNTKEVRITFPIFGDGVLIDLTSVSDQTKAEVLRDLSCKADAIVLGSPKSKASHLTEDETYIYTEYEFSVQNVIKDNSASPIKVNSSIQVTRPGGLIKLNDTVVKLDDDSYAPLQINKQYLLFLRYVPRAKGYIVSNLKGDFVLEKQSFKTMSKVGIPKEMSSDDAQSLLNELRNYILSDCGKTSTEDIH